VQKAGVDGLIAWVPRPLMPHCVARAPRLFDRFGVLPLVKLACAVQRLRAIRSSKTNVVVNFEHPGFECCASHGVVGEAFNQARALRAQRRWHTSAKAQAL
jgi:hypothetical protein